MHSGERTRPPNNVAWVQLQDLGLVVVNCVIFVSCVSRCTSVVSSVNHNKKLCVEKKKKKKKKRLGVTCDLTLLVLYSALGGFSLGTVLQFSPLVKKHQPTVIIIIWI